MKILFIGRDYRLLDDGGKIVTKRNLDLLKRVSEHVDEILKPRGNSKIFFKNILLGEGYGYTTEIKKQFHDLIKVNNYDFVWLDGSCDSSIAEVCARLKIPIICFYHNIESIFYSSKASNSKALQDKVFANYIRKIENKTSKLANFHILLNERDASEAERLYDIKTDLILPTSFPTIEKSNLLSTDSQDSYLLFVGSNFWANIEGLQYFFEKITPFIDTKVKIVGSICDSFRDQQLPDKVTLEGRVDDLNQYYLNAAAVISPILSGSGTKTKTIEALRFGKTIIGSPEALMGVPSKFYSCIGSLCVNDQEYIQAIKQLPNQKFNESSYDIFNKYYSDEAIFSKLETFIAKNFN